MTASAESDEGTEDPRIGTLLGARYRLLSCVGRGGMGAVYRAEHVELGRAAAVKVLASELARNHSAIERFLREARTASSINHPNIVHVYDLGRAPDGAPYLAMELLEGRDLARELEAHGGVLAPARVLEVLAPIADALDVCHGRGVVHRDLKPSNIVLARLDDGREVPKLVDFGLAMLLATDGRLTRTGAISGTPHYMPPEAARGELAGPAGDVYSLATLAYEALCGATPFDSPHPNGVLVKKLTEPAPPMRERAPGRYPDAIEAAIARALAIDPAARPESARALVRELASAIEAAQGEPWGPPVGTPPADESATSPEIPARRAHDAGAASLAATLGAAEGSRADRSMVRPARGAPSAASPGESAPRERRLGRVLAALLVLAALGATGVVVSGWWLSKTPAAPTRQTPAPPEPARPPDESAAMPPHEERAPLEGDRALEPVAVVRVEPPPSGPDEEASFERAPAKLRRELREPPPLAPSSPATPAPAPSPATLPPAPERVSAPEPTPAEAAAPRPAPDVDAPAPENDAEAERLVRSAGSLLLRGDHQGATALLERATRIAPRHAPAWRSLGLAHERAQRPADARRAYERYLELAPNAADAGRIRGRVSSL